MQPPGNVHAHVCRGLLYCRPCSRSVPPTRRQLVALGCHSREQSKVAPPKWSDGGSSSSRSRSRSMLSCPAGTAASRAALANLDTSGTEHVVTCAFKEIRAVASTGLHRAGEAELVADFQSVHMAYTCMASCGHTAAPAQGACMGSCLWRQAGQSRPKRNLQPSREQSILAMARKWVSHCKDCIICDIGCSDTHRQVEGHGVALGASFRPDSCSALP